MFNEAVPSYKSPNLFRYVICIEWRTGEYTQKINLSNQSGYFKFSLYRLCNLLFSGFQCFESQLSWWNKGERRWKRWRREAIIWGFRKLKEVGYKFIIINVVGASQTTCNFEEGLKVVLRFLHLYDEVLSLYGKSFIMVKGQRKYWNWRGNYFLSFSFFFEHNNHEKQADLLNKTSIWFWKILFEVFRLNFQA